MSERSFILNNPNPGWDLMALVLFTNFEYFDGQIPHLSSPYDFWQHSLTLARSLLGTKAEKRSNDNDFCSSFFQVFFSGWSFWLWKSTVPESESTFVICTTWKFWMFYFLFVIIGLKLKWKLKAKIHLYFWLFWLNESECESADLLLLVQNPRLVTFFLQS